MKIHTTYAGDKFLLDHITDTSAWSEKNRRRPSASRATRYFAISAGILIGLAAITFLSA